MDCDTLYLFRMRIDQYLLVWNNKNWKMKCWAADRNLSNSGIISGQFAIRQNYVSNTK